MTGDWLFTLTLITNFLCMAIAMWFSIYLLARSSANPITFRAVVALLALVFYYVNTLAELVSSTTSTGQVRSLSILIALIATHDLTHYMLPRLLRRKLYWAARAVVLFGVVAIVLLFNPQPANPCDPRYLCPSTLAYPSVVIDSFQILLAAAVLVNLWLIRKGEEVHLSKTFITAVLSGVSAIAYSLISTIIDLNLPRFISNLFVLVALSLLLYSASRDRTLITGRTSTYELPVSLITVAAIVGVYTVFAWQIELTPMQILLLAILAILTHTAYDFVRELLERVFRKQEHDLRKELRSYAHETDPERALEGYLNRALVILCHNLCSHSGWIALRQGDQCTVLASLHSMPVGSRFPSKDLQHDGGIQFAGTLMGQKVSFATAFAGPDETAVVGLRARNDSLPFSQEDLYWLEDIAEEIGWMINLHRRKPSTSNQAYEGMTSTVPLDLEEGIEAGKLFSKLAYKLDPSLVRAVEEAFRNLNDYSELGKTPLAGMLGIQAQDHIASGKQVQQKLVEMIGELRPQGEQPCEPLPREWYAYSILHGAYVEEKLAREIMAKLYISEGTYFRLRRQALRGVARALLETGAIV